MVQKAATRWLSYVHVVERCVIWHTPLMNSLNDIRTNPRYRDNDISRLFISDDELRTLKQFIVIGRACKSVIVSLEGAQHTTIGSMLWHHSRLIQYLAQIVCVDNVDNSVKFFCELIMSNSAVKFTVNVDRVAMISAQLDPRFKGLKFLSSVDITKCREALKNAYTDLEVELGDLDDITAGVVRPRKKAKINKPDIYTDFTADILDEASPTKGKEVKATEIDRYINHPDNLIDRKCDPLQWWKLHAGQYPKLAILAQRYLAIPASSAAGERLFSRLKRTGTSSRQGLKPDTLCMLLFVSLHQTKLM